MFFKLSNTFFFYNKILEKIESIFTSNNYDLTNIDNGFDQVIRANKMLITFTNRK